MAYVISDDFSNPAADQQKKPTPAIAPPSLGGLSSGKAQPLQQTAQTPVKDSTLDQAPAVGQSKAIPTDAATISPSTTISKAPNQGALSIDPKYNPPSGTGFVRGPDGKVTQINSMAAPSPANSQPSALQRQAPQQPAKAAVFGSNDAAIQQAKALAMSANADERKMGYRLLRSSTEDARHQITANLEAQRINNATNEAQQRYAIDQSRLGILQSDAARANDKWGIESGILKGQAADSEMIRSARTELSAAISSGDQAKIEAAKAKAVAAGIKFDKPSNEFAAVTDSMGMNITRTNKDTGAIDIIDPKTGAVKSIAAPGQQLSPQQELQLALQRAAGDPAKVKAINDRARANGVIQ